MYDILENKSTEISKFNISYSKVGNMFKIMLIGVLKNYIGSGSYSIIQPRIPRIHEIREFR